VINPSIVIGQMAGPWEDSPRRSALRSLALGPMDWTGSAAIVAMSDVAMTNAGAERDLMAIAALLWEHKPSGGTWTLDLPLQHALVCMPHLPPQRLRSFKLRLMTLEA
jgi:hypothetical protein